MAWTEIVTTRATTESGEAVDNPTGAAVHALMGDLDTMAVEVVTEAWQRIEEWLRDNAPITFAPLGPPATPEEATDAARRLDLEFPPDLTASLLRHGGATRGDHGFPLPDGFMLEGVHGLVVHAERMRKLDADNPEEDLEPGWYWPREGVGVAGGVSVDVLVVDCTPGAGFGRLGRHREAMGTSFEDGFGPCAPSIGSFLKEVADCPKQGRPFREGRPFWDGHPERPAVIDGRLIWRADQP